MEDIETHTFTVQVPSATARDALAGGMDEPLHPITVFALTLVVGIALSFVLLRQPSSRDRIPNAPKDEPEEYFQKILDDVSLDVWSGSEQGCEWSQTDDQVELTASLPAGTKGKDVAFKVLPGSISVAVRDTPIVQGTLLRKVRHDECEWTIEEQAGQRVLKVSLVKLVPTKGAQNWTSLLKPPDI